MKTKPILFFLFTLLLGNVFPVHGATLPHQGRVLIAGKAFEGTGSFRFALVDTAGNLVWNHQGTSVEPTTDLTLDVKGGFYSIVLGDPAVQGMADLPAALFSTHAGLKLRIWFNDGINGLQQIGTDQALLVAPYALSLDQESEQKIAGLEASLAQALARIATLEQRQSSGGSGGGSQSSKVLYDTTSHRVLTPQQISAGGTGWTLLDPAQYPNYVHPAYYNLSVHQVLDSSPGSSVTVAGGVWVLTDPSGGGQHGGGGYQSPGGGYQSPGSGHQSPGGGSQSSKVLYDTTFHQVLTPQQISAGGTGWTLLDPAQYPNYVHPAYYNLSVHQVLDSSPGSSVTVAGGVWILTDQSGGGQHGGGGYQSPGGDNQSPGSGHQSPGGGSQSSKVLYDTTSHQVITQAQVVAGGTGWMLLDPAQYPNYVHPAYYNLSVHQVLDSSPGSSVTVAGGVWVLTDQSGGGQHGGGGYQSPGGGYQTPTGATHVVDLNSTVNLEMIRVEPGTFTMGSPITEIGRQQDETEHNVTLTKPFYLGKYEVTQAQYEAVMTGNVDGRNPKPSMWPNNPNRPVELVRWSDIQIFLSRLNASEQAAGRLPAGWSYVLPTEAEWEYACRAGTTTAYFWGDTITPNNANHSTSGIGQTCNVGQYSANPWGFYDMHGNVWEWSADWYAAYSTSQLVDPIGPYTGSSRIVRGGSYSNVGTYSRAAMRNFFPPDNRNEGWGFRLAFKQQ